MRKSLLVLLLCACTFTYAQKKVKVLPFPSIGYAPETDWYFGAVAQFTFDFYQDSITRTSNLKTEFIYTLNNQLVWETQWNYFFKGDLWFTDGDILYSKYPDYYYGIGVGASEENEVRFQSYRTVIDFDVLRKTNNQWFLGGGPRFFHYSGIEIFEGDNIFDELVDRTNVGLRLIVQHDARDNILSPTKGKYFRVSSTHNVSKSYYSNLKLDFRRYWSLHEENLKVLAFRAYHATVFGVPPFYDYQLLGGDKLVRGYFLGRFRDKNLSTVQVEYRQNLFWIIGASVFGGVSAIYEDFKGFSGKNIKPNLGMGIRFLMDKEENTYLRFDYAVGSDDQDGFYISFGESF